MRHTVGIGALRCAAIVAVVLLTPAASADEDDVWIPPQEELAAFDPFAALDTLREQLGANEINLCGFTADNTGRAQELVSVTGNAVTVRCAGIDEPVVFPFALNAMFGVGATERRERLMHCSAVDGAAFYGRARRDGELRCLTSAGPRGRYDREALRRFVTTWTFLSQIACVRPADDAGVRQVIESAAPITPEIEESLRRTQVQAEQAIRENRMRDAATLYRAALTEHPNWAFGQFNHALLLGNLEFYPSAINRMRAYLVLLPNAPDARAVRDRTYEWEARLPRPPPP